MRSARSTVSGPEPGSWTSGRRKAWSAFPSPPWATTSPRSIPSEPALARAPPHGGREDRGLGATRRSSTACSASRPSSTSARGVRPAGERAAGRPGGDAADARAHASRRAAGPDGGGRQGVGRRVPAASTSRQGLDELLARVGRRGLTLVQRRDATTWGRIDEPIESLRPRRKTVAMVTATKESQ